MEDIIEETLGTIKERRGVSSLTITDIYLSNYFNCVKLNDGSVGACMNYAKIKRSEISPYEEQFRSSVKEDPLLLSYTSGGDSLLARNLRCCVVNALSAPLLRDTYKTESELPYALLRWSKKAVVIGLGGYLPLLLRLGIPTVHVCDLHCHNVPSMQRRFSALCSQYPSVTLTLSDGSDSQQRIAEADLVCVTGSALCNGTMEQLLSFTSPGQTVIVQGESASILPDALFARGVDVLTTTLKPATLIDTARRSFEDFRSLLESGLEFIHLYNGGGENGSS